MTVAELLSRISSKELSEWMIYSEMDPFGNERGDLQAGIVASTMANVFRDPKKAKRYSPGDFMPKFEDKKPKDSGELYALVRAWAILSNPDNAKVIKR